MIGAELDDTSPDSVDEGDSGAVRMSANRNLYVRIRDNAGNERGLNVDANGEIQISGSRNAILVSPENVTLPIDDAGGSITVDGTVTATRSDATPSAINITAADSSSSSSNHANSQAFITGSATANSTAAFALSGKASVTVQTTGTWTATIQAEASVDGGTTWTVRPIHQLGTGAIQNTWTGNVVGTVNTAGCTNFRIRCTAFTSGTCAVRVVTTEGLGSVHANSAIPVTDNNSSLSIDDGSGSITVDGTVAATQSGTWNVGTVTSITNAVPVTDNSGSLTVDNGGTFATQDSQSITDNAGFTDGTSKVFMSGYIYDETAGTALTENDAAAARINVNRAQISVLEDSTTRGRYATVTASNALKVDASGVAVPITDNSGSLTVDNAGTFAVQPAAATSGGLTPYYLISAASTNATNVKSSAGQIYSIYAHNTNAAVRYLKIYNTSGTPTVGTTSSVLILPIPASTTGAGFLLDTGGIGIAFSSGIAFGLTTGVANSDTGAVAANEIVINILYK